MTETAAAESTTSSATVNTRQGVQNALAGQGGTHLGDMVWWRLSGAEVSRAVLEAKWLAFGLDPKFLPEPQTAKKALHLAVNSAGTSSAHKAGLLVRPVPSGKEKLSYAIVKETPGTDKWDGTQLALVTLDVTSGVISTDNPSNETASIIINTFNKFLNTHPSRDVMSSMVKAVKAMKSVTLRDGGGVYWIPATEAAMIRALKGAVESLGGSHVTVLPVNDSAEAQAELAEAAKGSIEAELGDLRAEIDGFINEESSPRPQTLEDRLEAFENLRARAQLYQSILSVTVTDLETQLGTMETEVQKLLAAAVV